MNGWLVNDCLTCIPGTKTLWHDLLEIPGLQDKTFGRTPFPELADKIEHESATLGAPDYIVRNASYFRKLNIRCRTFSLLQDVGQETFRQHQVNVCNASTTVVVSCDFVKQLYPEITSPIKIIPIPVDFNTFKPLPDREDIRKSMDILPNSILFVGANNEYPKGFDILLKLISDTNHNFCLVMKDDFQMEHERVRVFNKITQDEMVKIYNACEMLVCTSRMETQHLAGIEAAACGLPLLVSNVGAYYKREEGLWGHHLANDATIAIDHIIKFRKDYQPREYFLKKGFDTESCRKRWVDLIEKDPEPWKGDVFV